MAEILAVCISEKKGEQKHPVDQVELKENWGITHVTLKPGDFAENILVKGITLYELPVGTRLKIGPEAVGEVTQIGKTCHYDCAIRKAAGDCVMPREGIFVKILTPGIVRPGDQLEVIEEA